MRTVGPADIRELFCYCLPGEREVGGAELDRRREAMWRDNPTLAIEYRSASRSADSWNEHRSSSRRSPMTLAELETRMASLEDLLGLEPGTLTS
jgi:hypothetical protein